MRSLTQAALRARALPLFPLLLASLLTACGGGGGDTNSDPAPTAGSTASVTTDRSRALAAPGTDAVVARLPIADATLLQSASVNADGPATTLIVRARGSLAGNVGPLMQLRIDGVAFDAVEVRASEPTDYRFAVPAMRPGTEVDVAFINDGNVNGADRNLYVSYVIAGDTFVLPSSPGVVLDRGTGAASYDGIDVQPGYTGLYSNSALRMRWPEPNMTDRVTVRASGSLAGGVGPEMQLRVDGVTVGSSEVRNAQPADHAFAVPPLLPGSRIDVVFANGGSLDGASRQLEVAYLMSGTTVLRPDAAGVTIDLGSGAAAFDGANVQPGQGRMAASGALRGRWPEPNMTDRITVRAHGSLAGGTGPLMEVRVGGIVLGTTEVRATTPADYSFATLPLQAGQPVDVAFVNDAIIDGADRNLTVGYLIAGDTYLQPTMDGVVYDRGPGDAAFDGVDVFRGSTSLNSSGALRAEWPAPNLTDRITVHASGSPAGGVAPLMQLRVDGVVVGTAEVGSARADHVFAVPAMHPGRRVDLAYLNDGIVNGVDRNLYVSYLVASDTFVLPASPGVRYDRGSGTAAFDDAQVVAGQGGMYWPGALRLAWPEPNITEQLTVRASGSLAGNVGPLMQLRVDGVVVSSVEVRSGTPSDYAMPVPPLRAGSRVDVVFANDAVIDGADRALRVDYLLAGNTFVLPTFPIVSYDRGSGSAAFDGADVRPGQPEMSVNGALRLGWPGPNITDSITVRASGSLAGGVGPLMQLRVNGVILGTASVTSTTRADYVFAAPVLAEGSRIDVVFLNDTVIDGQDRNLYVQYLKAGGTTLTAIAPTVHVDNGAGEAAFDGHGTAASNGSLNSGGAMRFTMPALPAADTTLPAQLAASRFLQQASFGPTPADINRLTSVPFGTWIDEQIAMPASADYVGYVQSKYDLGDDYRPGGSRYTPTWLGQRFWAKAATAPDQLRQRMAFALHQIFVVSQVDGNLFSHTRAYAQYLDTLNRHAFGNFRNLIEDIALSPVMGIYLSHMRNRPEDPASGRLPDENFARELMQLFTIGLHQLNSDGTARLDPQGRPIETYDNEDVMALAKVFTGYSWAFPDDQLSTENFRWASPNYGAAADQRIDLLPMKNYPGQHSTAEKRLFGGTPQAVVIAAGGTAQADLRQALDALFRHPNVGPFIGRQLIQHLVTSHPSAAYVARVAAKFDNNGAGVRGDLAAVVRAVLLDSEARNAPAADVGKLREPVLRVAHWMRSFGVTSASGEYMMAGELDSQSQRAWYAPSVFGYFRPGYVPPNTVFSDSGTTVPELQIVNETTTAHWANMALAMAGSGVGWTGSIRDVSSTLQPLVALSMAGNVDAMVQQLDLLLYAGRMSPALRLDLLEAITRVSGSTEASHLNRARVALFLALAASEYLVQR